MYSLRILFFSLPLYFSHVFSPIGVTLGESYSFERYKVYLFLTLLAIAYIEWLTRYRHRVWDIFCKHAHIILMLLVLPLVSAVYFATPLDIGWLQGSYEKHHGYLFYTGIVLLFPLLLASSREQSRSYLSWSLYAAIVVAIIAIGEYMWGVLDIYRRSEMISAYSGRSVSTLGNPNYVAGYLLIFVPLCTWWRVPERWIILWLLVLAILTTGSYIGIALVGAYILYSILRYLHISTMESFIWLSVWVIVGIYIGSLYLDPDKMGSLMSRFVLMWESISMMLRDPVSLLIWFGPDSLLTHFATERSSIIDAYFPTTSLIDSSHNIVIDILFQYGIVPLLLIGWYLYRYWYNQKGELQSAILLGGIFLVLNVFVVVHIVILSLLMVSYASHTRA